MLKKFLITLLEEKIEYPYLTGAQVGHRKGQKHVFSMVK
jgi:hypothetical protein